MDAAASDPSDGGGSFGLAVLVGIALVALVALVWKSLPAALPESDPLRRYSAEPELIARMIAENRVGRRVEGYWNR